MLRGQAVAVAQVRASDNEHARCEGHRLIEEAMDLLRYGQITVGWPPEPVPEFGLAAMAAYGYVQSHSLCVRLDKFDMCTNKSVSSGDGALIDHCKRAPAWMLLEKLLQIAPNARTEMQRRIMLGLTWVGQATLAQSNPVRLVALMTALETMLIEESETLGKRTKLAERVAKFPKMIDVNRQVSHAEMDQLYRIRSGCLHAGRAEVAEPDVRLASMAVAQTFNGILSDSALCQLPTLHEILEKILPSVDSLTAQS
jgi:hypothetical protein